MIRIFRILSFLIFFNVLCSSVNSIEEFNFVTLNLNSNIKLHMKIARFIPKKHKIKQCMPAFPVDKWKGVCLVDEKPVFGTDWEMPKYILQEAYIEVKKKKIPLDTSCMYNPWFTFKPDAKNFTIQNTEGGFLVNGIFSDGAGTYGAQWLIIEGVSVRTKLGDLSEPE